MNEFGSLAGRSQNALSNRANFVGDNGKHFLYLWDLIDKYDLMKTCMQINYFEFAAASGDNVRIIYHSKRAQLKDDEEDDASSISSKQSKLEMSTFGGSIMKLAAQEKEKDRQKKEKDCILQQKQSLELEISRLRQDKRGYLIQMSERDEKRRKTRRNIDDDDGNSIDTFQMCIDDIVEEIQEKKAKLEQLVRVESDMTNKPLKSNVTPPRTDG
jgi:chromosome segregation ATPase